jgi:hypothetical protein
MRNGARRGGTAVVALTVLVAVVAGCGNNRAPEGQSPVAVTSDVAAASPTTEPTVVTTTAAPTRSATASPTPRPSRTTKAGVKRPAPTPKPPIEVKVPPAPPKPAPINCKPKRVGTQVTRAEAKKALTDAAGRTYWPTSAPSIKVPLNLVKATAWQESGWQSNIIACDTGVGLMQVMPDTVTWMNDRFGQSYDINDYADNATLGANYLAWLIKWFGDRYFGSDFTITAADCADDRSSLCLLNLVIASYNFGFGAMETTEGLVIPNPDYVENVRALMTECECLAF